jgi:hypothetical protein
VTALTKSEEAIERRYANATSAENRQKAKDKLQKAMSSFGKDARAEEDKGKEDESTSTTGTDKSTDHIDEKKDENETERNVRTNVTAKMQQKLNYFSSSVKAKDTIGSGGKEGSSSASATPSSQGKFNFLVSAKPSGSAGSVGESSTAQSSAKSSPVSEDGESTKMPPSVSLKRFSDVLGQAKKSTAAPSSLKMSFGAAKASFASARASSQTESNPISSLKPSFSIGNTLKSKISPKAQINASDPDNKVVTNNEEESITFHAPAEELEK